MFQSWAAVAAAAAAEAAAAAAETVLVGGSSREHPQGQMVCSMAAATCTSCSNQPTGTQKDAAPLHCRARQAVAPVSTTHLLTLKQPCKRQAHPCLHTCRSTVCSSNSRRAVLEAHPQQGDAGAGGSGSNSSSSSTPAAAAAAFAPAYTVSGHRQCSYNA
jgi:hypothetical protein